MYTLDLYMCLQTILIPSYVMSFFIPITPSMHPNSKYVLQVSANQYCMCVFVDMLIHK